MIINTILLLLLIILPVGIIIDIIYSNYRSRREFNKRQEKYKKMI